MAERTFLLTDVEGSTRLWEEHPAEMASALELHDEIAARVVESFGGELVKGRGEGDSAFVVFEDERSAVRCAIALQLELHAAPWPGPAALRVRIGVHCGDAHPRGGEFYGSTVNRCARLRDAAHGGQTVVSDVVRTRVGEPGDGAVFTDLGLHRLKDLAQPQRVWQVSAPGLPQRFPALRSLDARGHNLPTYPTMFIGRDIELDDVLKLLASSRLVTLTGAGGAGKTRLALQAAAEAADVYADGVWLVELASLTDPLLVSDRVAAVLGLRAQPGRTMLATVTDHLASRAPLLVLDNCEHLAAACADFVAAVMSGCPDVRVLATSRERLRVYGESVYAVPPMETPRRERIDDLEELASYDAVRLFCDRAALVRHAFTLTPDNADDVAALTVRLDGVPLAIELAAGLANDIGIADMARRLDERLALLTVGPRTVDPRHQTLRAALEWSYELLTGDERATFARLAVFAGGFDLDAAVHVCAAPDVDVRRAIVALAEKSLLTAAGDEHVTRFAMLETVREYANERLAGLEDEVPARRHANWFFDLADRGFRESEGPEAGAWTAVLEREHDNMRAALAWMTRSDPTLALRMCGFLGHFWQARGYLHEGRRLSAAALAAYDGPDERLAAKGAQTVANLAIGMGDYDGASELMSGVVDYFRTLGDDEALCSPLMTFGGLAFYRGDYRTAVAAFEEALGIAVELGRTDLESALLGNLASAADSLGDFPAALAYADRAAALARESGNVLALIVSLSAKGSAAQHLEDYATSDAALEEALGLAREAGDQVRELRLLNNLGAAAVESGRLERARPLCEEALSLATKAGERRNVARAQINLGALEAAEGRFEEASRLFAEGLQGTRDIGDQAGVSEALRGLGEARRGLGDAGAAQECFLEALAIACTIGEKYVVARTLHDLAGLAAATGDAGRAARLLGAASAIDELAGVPSHDDDVPGLRAALGDVEFMRAWDAGRALTLDEIPSFASAQ